MDDSPRRPPACTPWAAVLEELPLLTRAQLVNGLAVSLGTTALMARRILRNERVGLVAAAVVAAYNALSRSLPLLPPGLLPTDAELTMLPDILSLPADSWDDYLARLAPAEAAACRQTVDEVVAGMSRAARAIRENQAAGSVVAPLLEARSGLARLYAQLSTAPAG